MHLKHLRALVLIALADLSVAPSISAQPLLLDDFEMLSGWRAIPSEGAEINITSGQGRTGKAMVMEFTLLGVHGYTIAQKDFSLDLPPNYQFTFDMRAECPINNFEFKLIDEKGNVFWIKKLNIQYPIRWERQRIRKRHIAYAWGPSGGSEIRKVAKIEFVVSSGTGGKGRVFIDNFGFEPIDETLAKSTHVKVGASSMAKGGEPTMNDKGTLLTNWRGTKETEWLSINFNYLKEIGGLLIDWEKDDYATMYDVQLSDDGKDWTTAYSVTNGNGGRDYIYLPEKDVRALRINIRSTNSGQAPGIVRLEVKGAEFSQTPNDFFFSLAQESRTGLYPKYFLNQQSFWTIVGSSGDTKEALMNEQGAIEVDQLRFSLEPFLYVNGRLVTWSDVVLSQSLENDYLPIPSVKWTYGGLELTVRAFSAGAAGKSILIASYSLENRGSAPPRGKLFVALRPFQVNPPWQRLNNVGGASRIDSIRADGGVVYVQDKTVIPVSAPTQFGATGFDSGDITDYLQQGVLPSVENVVDARGFASAALEYDFNVPSGVSHAIHIAVPFHEWSGSPTPNMQDGADIYVSLALDATRQYWESKLNNAQISLPEIARPIVNTIKSTLAYIFINRDGPGIQPGSRSYERSWIRDGSLTSTALLEFGVRDEVREYLDWYAKFQFPSGKIPCVVDQRGGDPTAEHDSHGEFIYAVMTYFNFTHDTTWLKGKFDSVVKTVRYIQALRAERKTGVYKNGTPEQQACFGLVPESISHEGYSAQPMHSYWDDFFVLRGLKDAATMALLLHKSNLATEFAAERDDMRTAIYTSLRMAMKNRGIDYIPGCVELGDFDATSTTIAVHPANELRNIPEPQLHNTFDKYFSYFEKRRDGTIDWKDYTPYENRVIGTFVYLDQKDRAHAALDFFMKDRRPQAWNQWAEVVHHDPSTPKFVGDIPHTWCGSDFLRSVRAMFVYERESDESLVIGAGIADAWVNDTSGVRVANLPTHFGTVSYSIKKVGRAVVVRLEGSARVPSGKVFLKSPLSKPITAVKINGRKAKHLASEIHVRTFPSTVEISY